MFGTWSALRFAKFIANAIVGLPGLVGAANLQTAIDAGVDAYITGEINEPAVHLAREQDLTIVGLSDSPASPILRAADHGFLVASETPQFFPSSVPTIALLETLLSFVIAVASPEIVTRVDTFHARRHRLGIYAEDGS